MLNFFKNLFGLNKQSDLERHLSKYFSVESKKNNTYICYCPINKLHFKVKPLKNNKVKVELFKTYKIDLFLLTPNWIKSKLENDTLIADNKPLILAFENLIEEKIKLLRHQIYSNSEPKSLKDLRKALSKRAKKYIIDFCKFNQK